VKNQYYRQQEFGDVVVEDGGGWIDADQEEEFGDVPWPSSKMTDVVAYVGWVDTDQYYKQQGFGSSAIVEDMPVGG
jgi:hypothetical protein